MSAFHPDQDSPIYPLNTNKPPRRSCLPGCLGMLIALVIGLAIVGGIGVAIMAVFLPNALNGIMGALTGVTVPQTRSLPGSANASAFDPIETFSAVAAFAGSDAQLTSMTATNVRSDGTLDLNRPIHLRRVSTTNSCTRSHARRMRRR